MRRPVRAQVLEDLDDVAAHDHSFHEMGLVVAGAGRHLAVDGAHELRPGSLYLIPPHETHAIEAGEGLSILNLYYMVERLAEDLPALWEEPGLVPLFLDTETTRRRLPRRRQVQVRRRAALEAEIRSLVVESAWVDPSPLILRSGLLKVGALAARAWRLEDPDIAQGQLRAAVRREIAWLDELAATGAPLSNDPQQGLSADHLSELFRESIGLTRQAYFQQRRIHRACTRLLGTNDAISQIAMDLGYADAPHFCRHFRRHRGQSPGSYRRSFG
ncbi:transcription regulator [Oceanicola granulosus HTCC2516]|uniref:Transcription regulator n=2 Tax=Oceanicola granulosus TaxID=252302 RepID=Q2CH50_OCEGH|nr:transcription regulator [Oceanicola granulosus HTCC2516]